jgi:hypothetical protein
MNNDIDVSKCDYYGYEGECIIELKHCSNFLNCLYRQLQRKTQEYEKSNQVLEDIKNYCKDVKFDFGSKPVAIDILKIIEKGQ